jgi:hypothetical protein
MKICSASKQFLLLFILFAFPAFTMADTSAKNRKDHDVSFGVFKQENAFPAVAYWNIGESVQFGVFHAVSNNIYSHGFSKIYSHYETEGLIMRVYLSESYDSLNISLLTENKTLDADVYNKYKNNEAELDITLQYRVNSLGIGNQWTFDNGTVIGLDWIIYPYDYEEKVYDYLKVSRKNYNDESINQLITTEKEYLEDTLIGWYFSISLGVSLSF